MDTGDILTQEKTPIGPDDTAQVMRKQLMTVANAENW